MSVCKTKFLKFFFLLLISFEFAFSLNLNKNDLNSVVSDIILQCEISQKDKSKCETESFIKSNLIKKRIKFDNKSLKDSINFAINSNEFINSKEPLLAVSVYSDSPNIKEKTKPSITNSKKNSKDKIEIFFSDENENSVDNATDDLANTKNTDLENKITNDNKISFDFNNIQEIMVRSSMSSNGTARSGGSGKCNQCHDSPTNDTIELDGITVTAYSDDTINPSWRDNVIDVISMFLGRGALKNTGLNRQRLLIAKNNPKAYLIIVQNFHKEQIIDLFENGAKHIYIGNKKYLVKEVTSGQKGAKIFSNVSEKEIFQFYRETAGVEKMPKAINIYDKKTGDFKGIEYVVKNGDGSSIILRNFSTSGVGDWTLQLSKIPNANPNMELKFTDVIK